MHFFGALFAGRKYIAARVNFKCAPIKIIRAPTIRNYAFMWGKKYWAIVGNGLRGIGVAVSLV